MQEWHRGVKNSNFLFEYLRESKAVVQNARTSSGQSGALIGYFNEQLLFSDTVTLIYILFNSLIYRLTP